ncbi:hypothetical protein [Flavobacterium selenitireducens]|uniref:hypothetical protein n=1 Tax=Flavobacterium selenitireducens TaxID=2722704 RepID=UPI00168ABE2C|nr:hypothetical protein [Flavobacterium selenitireducens]MBD3582993.1 hypothetical protein [Flavobacterium selenitireducens]
MKNIIGLLALILLFSCSDEKSGDSAKFRPVSVDLDEGQGQILITYDDEDRVKSIEEPGSTKYIFSYEANKVSRIVKVGGDRPGYYNFYYEGNKITHYTFEGDTFPTIYDEPQNILSNGVNLYPNGEIKNCVSPQGQIITLTYDTSNKGAMYRANHVILPMLLIERDASFFAFHLTKHQLAGYGLDGDTFDVGHDLDQYDFPQQSHFQYDGGTFSTFYQYEPF